MAAPTLITLPRLLRDDRLEPWSRDLIDELERLLVEIGMSMGAMGAGTVTSVSGGTGITNSPEPIVGVGSVNLDIDSLIAETVLAATDTFPFYDDSAVGTAIAKQRKVTFANLAAAVGAATDHGSLTGLGDDDHLQYLLIAGRAAAANNPLLSTTAEGQLTGSGGAGSGLRLISNIANDNSIFFGAAGTSTFNELSNTWGFGVSAAAERVTVLGNILLVNTGTAGELRLREPSAGGTSYTGFTAGALGGNIIYRLPLSSAAGVLTNDGADNTSWEAAATGTVTSVAGGVGITNTPEPIVGVGTVDLDINSLTTVTTIAAGDLIPFVLAAGAIADQRIITRDDLAASLSGVVTIRVEENNVLLGLATTLDFNDPDNAALATFAAGEADITMTGYALLDGRPGLQTLTGSSTAGGLLSLQATPGGLGAGIIQFGTLFPSAYAEATGYWAFGGFFFPTFLVHARDGDIAIDNTDGTARRLVFYEPSGSGTNLISFKAPILSSGDTEYTLPNAFPLVSGQALVSTTAGVMSWATPAGSVVIEEDNVSLGAVTTLDFAEPDEATWIIVAAGEAELNMGRYARRLGRSGGQTLIGGNVASTEHLDLDANNTAFAIASTGRIRLLERVVFPDSWTIATNSVDHGMITVPPTAVLILPGGANIFPGFFYEPTVNWSGAQIFSALPAFLARPILRPTAAVADIGTFLSGFQSQPRYRPSVTGASTGTLAGFLAFPQIDAGAGITATVSDVVAFQSWPTFFLENVLSATAVVTRLVHFKATDPVVAVGGTIATHVGLDVPSLIAGTTITAGVRTAVTAAATKWNVLSTGTADSALMGALRLLSNAVPTAGLHIATNGTLGHIRMDGIAGNPAAPADGDYWFNSTQEAHRFRAMVGTQGLVGATNINTADSTTLNGGTAGDQAFSTNYAFPANSLKAGKGIRLTWGGRFTAAGTVTAQIKVKLGGVTFVDFGAQVILGTDSAMRGMTEIIVRSIGAGGTAVAVGTSYLQATAPISVTDGNAGTVAVDTTVSRTIELTVAFAGAGAGVADTMALQQFLVEVLD